MKARVVKLEGEFIPQIKEGWFYSWAGIAIKMNGYPILSNVFRETYKTLEEAIELIEYYVKENKKKDDGVVWGPKDI